MMIAFRFNTVLVFAVGFVFCSVKIPAFPSLLKLLVTLKFGWLPSLLAQWQPLQTEPHQQHPKRRKR